MTISEMHTNVKLELDKTAAFELPAFETEEIDFWLDSAIRRFVKLRYREFEKNQKRLDDIRTLVAHYTDSSLTSSTDYPNAYYANIPYEGSGVGNADYWLTLGEEVTISVSGTTSRVGVTECTIDEYRQFIDDPYSEHKLHYQTAKPLRIFNDDSVELVTDGNYSVTVYYLTYLKKPTEVNYTAGTDCNLPEHTHDEVVKLAVNMMLENIEQPRYQTHMNEVNTME